MQRGTPFPDFRLPDQSGEERTLADYTGAWLVVYFYPRDNTSGCTTEALSFAALQEDFAACGAAVVGISADSVTSHEKFAAKHCLPFTLLSDEAHVLLEACGVWQKKKMAGREYMGIVRSTALLDPQGVVRAFWPKVKVPGHADEVLATLTALRKG